MKKIESVLDLSKYRVDQTVFWVVLRPVDEPRRSLFQCDKWMRLEHPKVWFDRKVLSPLWKSKRKIPKMHAQDFMAVTQLVTQRLGIEEFIIKEVSRSPNTGEFSYKNECKDQMPESFLFGRHSEAVKEASRLQQLLFEWTQQQEFK